MGTYQYVAKTAAGQQVTGAMQADSETAVLRTLDERELFAVGISQQCSPTRGTGKAGKIRLRHLSATYGQLADLLKAGVPMLRALETIARATSNRKLSGLILAIRDDVAAGKTLADAMAAHGATFTPLHSAMVKAGERAGFLEEVLANLAEFLQRQDELQGKLRGAMIYPMVLTCIGAIAMTAMLIVLVPRFKPFFQNMPLPLPTVVLFAASDLLVGHKWLLLALAVLLAAALRAILHSKAGRRRWDSWRLRLPILGRVIRTVSITRFCRILGTMLANGVPILQALSISKDATGSAVLAESIERAAESVRAGKPLAEPLRAGGMFPVEIIEMIAVAEESNQLDGVLVHVAETVERRVNRLVDGAVRLIEPLVLVVIAAVIGFAAVGLMWPIFMMSQALR